MNRKNFKLFVRKSLTELKLMAEQYAYKELPEIHSFQWMGDDQEVHKGIENIIEAITEVVYMDGENIYPCVDLHVKYDENRLTVLGSRASYSPRPFQKGWSGRPGPFIYCINVPSPAWLDTNSNDFKNKLIDMGFLHYPKEK